MPCSPPPMAPWIDRGRWPAGDTEKDRRPPYISSMPGSRLSRVVSSSVALSERIIVPRSMAVLWLLESGCLACENFYFFSNCPEARPGEPRGRAAKTR